MDWEASLPSAAQYNATKLAVMIEGRPLPRLVPQLLHMIAVSPPDWRFMFIGTPQSVIGISRSFAIQYHEVNGKINLVVLQKPFSIENEEHVYRLLTNSKFNDTYMNRVEWMLEFESDSIMCANLLRDGKIPPKRKKKSWYLRVFSEDFALLACVECNSTAWLSLRRTLSHGVPIRKVIRLILAWYEVSYMLP